MPRTELTKLITGPYYRWLYSRNEIELCRENITEMLILCCLGLDRASKGYMDTSHARISTALTVYATRKRVTYRSLPLSFSLSSFLVSPARGKQNTHRNSSVQCSFFFSVL